MIRLVTATLTAIGLLFVSAAGPAVAEPQHDGVTEFDFVVDDFCGDMSVRVWGEFRGWSGLVDRGNDDLDYYRDRFHGFHNYTNLATGKTVKVVSTGPTRDVHVRDNGDGTLTIVWKFSGHEVMYGPDGRRLGQWSGTTKWKVIADHAGTPGDSEDDVLVSETVVHSSGPRGADKCVLVRLATA